VTAFSQSDPSLQTQAEHVLEWDVVLHHLAEQSQSAMGRERCLALALETDIHEAQARQDEVTEILSWLDGSKPCPSLAFHDVGPFLVRAEKGGRLDGMEFRDLSQVLGISQEVKQAFSGLRSEVPALWNLVGSLDELVWVKRAIDRCIDREGSIRESASAELSQLIQHTQDLRRRVRQRLESILTSPQYEEIFQERYFAQRNNRYVLPVKAERQHEIPGIVHDLSGSGATVFLEPRELIEINNAIKVGDLHTTKEINRILQELSEMVSTHGMVIKTNLDILATFDCLVAKARLSQLMNGCPLRLNDGQRMVLKQARHPLLVLTKEKEKVIANDIEMDDQTQVLVISGPNAGGKTVSLKLVGLFALMVRAGLRPPCSEGSEIPIFPHIYADIGDAQDLNRDLSSFSAHMTMMITLFRELASFPSIPRQASLVLLDEIGRATDPIEGAALAEALLERLMELGGKVLVTTHYQQLKTLAFRKAGVVNASQAFDIQTLSPTYRLVIGLPGGSSALEIADRLGLDGAILKQAQCLLHGQEHDLDQVIHRLQKQRQSLTDELEKTRMLRAEASAQVKEAQAITERLQAGEQQERRTIQQRFRTEFSKAKVEIHRIVEALRKETTLLKGKAAHQRLAAIQDELRPILDSPDVQPLDCAGEGDEVEIYPLGTRGVLLETTTGKKRAKVQVGSKEISVDIALLRGVPRTPDSGTHTGRPEQSFKTGVRSASMGSNSSPSFSPSLFPPSVDLRGKDSEEALAEIVAAFDRGIMNGASIIRIIHGHGSGTLKRVVRKFCGASPYVNNFRSGKREEGGDGVTIVELR